MYVPVELMPGTGRPARDPAPRGLPEASARATLSPTGFGLAVWAVRGPATILGPGSHLREAGVPIEFWSRVGD